MCVSAGQWQSVRGSAGPETVRARQRQSAIGRQAHCARPADTVIQISRHQLTRPRLRPGRLWPAHTRPATLPVRPDNPPR